MKKFLQNLLVISISIGIFSCSKKVTTFNFGKPYHETNATSAKIQNINVSDEIIKMEDNQLSASQGNDVSTIKPVSINIEKTDTKPLEITNTPEVKKEKQSFKTKTITKLLKKKIEKLEKQAAIDNNMKIGIVIAAISLVVLIVVAAGLLGGLSGLFWLLGGLGLLTGLIIILLSALDVI